MSDTIRHTAPLWRWNGNGGAAWFFITIDGEAGETLSTIALMRKLEEGRQRGWGSLKVDVSVGASRWSTSVFPAKSGGWMLPVKKEIRRAEDLAENDPMEVTITL